MKRTGLVLALALAGCVAAPQAEVAPSSLGDLLDLESLLVVDHDHTDATLHTAASTNFADVGFTDLALGTPSDANTALDVVDGWAVLGLAGTTSGFTLVDVRDPANPVPVSRFLAPNTYGADVKFNHDASLVFLATQWGGDPTSPATWSRFAPARLAENPMVWGVYVVNVADKEKPTLESVLPLYRGAHTVHYHEIGGEPYVFACTYWFLNAGVGSKENPVATKVVISHLEKGPTGRWTLRPVSEYTRNLDPAVVAGQKGRVFPHELSVSESPVDGRTYAWVSYWDEGLVVLDVTEPESPRVVGAWKGFEEGDGAIHYAATFPQLIAGRQVTIAGPEWQSHDSSGHWWALDTTDLSDIRTIGFWTLPGSPPFDANYRFSPHNFDLYGTWVVAANYHAGVWVWDVERLVTHFNPDAAPGNSTPSSVRIPLGELLHGESAMDGHGDLLDVVGWHAVGRTPRSKFFGGESPLLWAVLLRDGHLFTSDMDSGLGVLRLTDLPPDATGMHLKGP